ncbi:MAG: hypothetical protein N2314_01580 [Brevinematales bacterium]|nr:hypothetical protein [Brevinematales bacterium]
MFQLEQSLPSGDHVLGRLGYNPTKAEISDWRSQIEQAIGEFAPLLSAKGIVKIVKVVSRSEEHVALEGGLVLVSQKLARILSSSDEVSVLAATLGVKVVEKIENLLEAKEIAKAAILDAIASESVEHFVDWMQAILVRERLRLGYAPTMRFSPGYGDWRLDVQPQILTFLGAEEIGLSSHPQTYVLQPEKSITAVLGWEKR